MKTVANDKRTLIIAEAGVNHDGDLDKAIAQVDCAVNAVVDVVKFQTFSAEDLATPSAPLAPYQAQDDLVDSNQYEMLKRLQLTEEALLQLSEYARIKRIEFLSTAFDIPSLHLITRLDLKRIKVPSGEITNLPLLQAIGRLGMPVLLSTGMSTLEEVKSAVSVLGGGGTPQDQITALHCTSAYPAPKSEVNLLAMLTLRNSLGLEIGYSDHTLGLEISLAAVALGARVIEKHVTISRDDPGPDHRASLEPHELRSMVEMIRNVEDGLGNAVKEPTIGEMKNREIVRKSIVASRMIKAGEVFSRENICCKRPGTGISPMSWEQIIGSVAERDYQANEQIQDLGKCSIGE